ncbi:MAG: hypothetical protein ACTSRE_01295 [Promethearchaeota archaeon]
MVEITFNYIKKTKVTFFLSFILISIFFLRHPVSRDIPVASTGTYVPAGIIGMWANPLSEVPSGWTLCDGTGGTPNTTDRFVYNTDGVEDPGSTGGASNHSHGYDVVPYHDHGATSTTAASHNHLYGRATSGVGVVTGGSGPGLQYGSQTGTSTSAPAHSHGVSTAGTSGCETDEIKDLSPPYTTLGFIKKETHDPTIPVGLIVMWTGDVADIPTGWALCNGSENTPDLREKFILGTTSLDPGEIGGNQTHSHNYIDIPLHSHSTSVRVFSHSHGVYAYPVGFSPFLGPDVGVGSISLTSTESSAHTHTMSAVGQSVCTTEEADHLPSYTAVAFIMNTQLTTGLPMGVISYWGGSISKIPLGWDQCDGTDGTLDMRNRFMRGNSTGEAIGTTGGSASHSHSYNEVPYHNHDILTGTMPHNHQFYICVSSAMALGGGTGFSTSGGATSTTTTATFNHNHDILPTGSSGAFTFTESNFPPYVELALIQQVVPLTSIGWASPDLDETILFPRTSSVIFDFEYAWSGYGNDITLSLSNGTDDFNAGSVWGTNQVIIDYLSGDVTAILHLWQDGTELTNDTRSFIFINNRAPTVTIQDPNGGETIVGTYTIDWSGTDPDGDLLSYTLSYNINGAGWVELVEDTTSTSYVWDTTTVSDSDSVELRIEVDDGYGGEDMDETDAVFEIKNTKIPGYNTLILISLLMVSALLYGRKIIKK